VATTVYARINSLEVSVSIIQDHVQDGRASEQGVDQDEQNFMVYGLLADRI
jgi:hypothetical protein